MHAGALRAQALGRVDVLQGCGGIPASALEFRIEPTEPQSTPSVETIVVESRRTGRGRGSSGMSYWYLARRPGAPPLALPAVIRYGVVPAGYTEDRSPVILPLGKYEISVRAGGAYALTYFEVTPQGRIE